MMSESIALCESMRKVLECLLPVFTMPSGSRFLWLVAGWLLATGRRTITGMVRAAGLTAAGHYSSFYRFFCHAVWSERALCRTWAMTIAALFYPQGDILCCGDDSLMKHRGPKIHGAGIYRDAVLSSRGMTVFHWGHNWVVLCLLVKFPLWPHRWFAFPINFRLRVKGENTTVVELMREMFHEAAEWFPGRTLVFCVDGTYSNLCGQLPAEGVLIGRLRGDAALFERPPKPKPHQMGRHRVRGRRLPHPKVIATDPKTAWTSLKVWTYGQRRTAQVHSFLAIWSHVSKREVRVLLVRDPAQPDKVDYFFCTDIDRPIRWVIETYAARWSIERTFEDVKQFLGVEHPQVRAKRSVQRVLPMGMILYGAVVLWYVKHAARRPMTADAWYHAKPHASFRDMLAAVRHTSRREYLFSRSAHMSDTKKVIETILQTLEAAA